MSTSNNRRILSLRERERLKREIQMRENMLRGRTMLQGKNGNSVSVDRYNQFINRDVHEDMAKVKKRRDELNKVLSDGTPDVPVGHERHRLENQMKQDAEFLRKMMISKKLTKLRATDPDFRKVVEAQRKENSPVYQKVASRYKDTARTLFPDEPERSNLESIRPE